ncbi:uncharacterized protein LOC126886244 [Diabrotica virgifera virgifera]|uniref:Uncharacterized protein LOC114342726 n=1 Tax=Diabrotica virgifera virgifera TaxID=50390 RepID=A0A6P7GVC1_DIAVI|nr:uncharacterized protein LOC126886244 [Diabrotica virgifera virgifera]
MFIPYIIFALDIANFVCFNSVYVPQVLGLDGPYTFFGITGTATAFFSFLWKPIAGRLSDEKGPTLLLFWCMVGGLVGTILSYLSGSLYFLFFARIIASIGSPSQIILRTIITQLDAEHQAEHVSRLGIIGALIGVGAALLSGHLMELSNGFSYLYSIIILNSILILGFVKLLPVIQPNKKEESELSKPVLEEITTALKNLKTYSTSTTYSHIFLLKALTAISYGIPDMNMVLIFNSIGIKQKNIAYMFTVMCIVTVLSNIALLKINKKYYIGDIGYRRIFHSSLLLAAANSILSGTSNLWVYVSFILIISCSRVQTDNTTMELLLQKIGSDEKAVVLGCFDSIQSLSDLLCPIISSLAMQFVGMHSVYTISAVFITLCSAIVYRAQSLAEKIKKQ